MSQQITNTALSSYARIIQALAHFKPHAGQIKVGQALFTHNIRNIFVQCGRKWGKTELGVYFATRWAMMNPGLGCFYIAPELKQARKLVWEDPRLLGMIPRDWIDGEPHNSDMRIRLKNGAYLKVEGSDNFEAHRGTRPGIVIYEEYKDHDPRFRNIMRPNLSVYNAPEIFLGTPPDRECEYTAVAKEHQSNDTMFFYQAPTWENPHIPRSWLLAEKKRLYGRGEGDVWEREYEAKYVKGGAKKIFPMWGDHLVIPHHQLMKHIEREKKRINWMHWSDPATATTFATLFGGFHRFNKEIYLFDHIYETRQGEMSVRKIWPRIEAIQEELWTRDWRKGYDEAALWYANEMQDNFDEDFEPSHKHLNDKESGLSLIKDIMTHSPRLLYVSDRCEMFTHEVDNYYMDKNGKIPKVNDHLIDDFRYMLGAEGYTLNPEREVNPDAREDFRMGSFKNDFPEYSDEKDLSDDLSGMQEDRLWKE